MRSPVVVLVCALWAGLSVVVTAGEGREGSVDWCERHSEARAGRSSSSKSGRSV